MGTNSNTALGFFAKPKTKQGGNSGYRTPTALSKSMATPKLLSLFDEDVIAGNIPQLKEDTRKILLTRKGKPVSLTPKQRQLVSILSDVLDQDRGEDIRNFIEWTEKVEERGIAAAGKQPNPIARTIHLKDIVKDMYGRSDKEQIMRLRREMDALINTTQVMVLGKQQIRVEASIIMRDISIRDESPEERGLDYYRIIYGSVFLWNKNKRFGVRPDNLYLEWNKKGSILNTEIGSVFYSLIQSVMWNYWRKADLARKRIKEEAKREKWSKDEAKAREDEAVNLALMYDELYSTLKSRLEADYSSTKQYRAKFKKDLAKVMETLYTLGMISGGYVSKGKGQEEKAVFIISERLRESTRYKPTTQLLPTIEDAEVID